MSFSIQTLQEWLNIHGIQEYRAAQILKWIFQRQVDLFENMTDLSKQLRNELSENFIIDRLIKLKTLASSDGSYKYLFQLHDGNNIETVIIPERDHYTLCVSTQVGCAYGCNFCVTGKGGFIRNLTSWEIVQQIRDISFELINDPNFISENSKPLSNIVFMGMGEPLANFDNLIQALQIITNNDFGLRFSTRHVTVSTVGLVPKIVELGTLTKVKLAVSLNASNDLTRNELMPINKKYPLDSLLNACKSFPLAPGRRITFEYILIKDVNDSEKDAFQLVDILRPLRCKINLIPFNEHDKSSFKRPLERDILNFQKILINNHYTAIIRRSKGEDISAACGQLRFSSEISLH